MASVCLSCAVHACDFQGRLGPPAIQYRSPAGQPPSTPTCHVSSRQHMQGLAAAAAIPAAARQCQLGLSSCGCRSLPTSHHLLVVQWTGRTRCYPATGCLARLVSRVTQGSQGQGMCRAQTCSRCSSSTKMWVMARGAQAAAPRGGVVGAQGCSSVPCRRA
jgi:hypothetical protein